MECGELEAADIGCIENNRKRGLSKPRFLKKGGK